MNKHIIFGHRGTNNYQENTLQSILDIHKFDSSKFDFGVEIDIQYNYKINKFICFHDETLTRLYNINKKVSHLYEQELLKYNICILDDILLTYNDDKWLNIEIKVYDDNIRNLYDNLVILLEQYKLRGNLVITSFDVQTINILLDKKIRCGLIMMDFTNEIYINDLIKKGMKILVIEKDMFELISKSKYYDNVYCYVYTLFKDENHQDIILLEKVYYEKNKIGIITDNIDNVIQVFKNQI